MKKLFTLLFVVVASVGIVNAVVLEDITPDPVATGEDPLPTGEDPQPCGSIASGTCGEHLTWELSCDSVLTISGKGEMENYKWENEVPWYEKRESMRSVVLSDSVTSIGQEAFDGCFNVTSANLPNSVTSIGLYAFTGTRLPSPLYNAHIFAYMPSTYSGAYTIPYGIESIAGYAFIHCTDMTSITIPSSVTNIGFRAFTDCMNLSAVYISDITAWCAIQFETDRSNPLFATYSKLVKDHGADLYLNGQLVTDLVLPKSVTSIGDFAFTGCNSITSVEIPNSVTHVGAAAFYGCKNMTSLRIGENVSTIGNYAFVDCGRMNSITCEAIIPPVLTLWDGQEDSEIDVFAGIDKSTCVLYVPEQSVEAYKAAAGWSEFENILPIGSIAELDYIKNGDLYYHLDVENHTAEVVSWFDYTPYVAGTPGAVTLVVHFDQVPCNDYDILFVGNYEGCYWQFETAHKFEAVRDGWYKVVLKPGEVEEWNGYCIQGRPIQAQNGKGEWHWDWSHDFNDLVKVKNTTDFMFFNFNSYDANLGFFKDDADAAKVVYLRSKKWNMDPCAPIENYNITLKAPEFCGKEYDIEVRGSFEGWGESPVKMTKNGNTYTATIAARERDEFMFRGIVDGYTYDSEFWSVQVQTLDMDPKSEHYDEYVNIPTQRLGTDLNPIYDWSDPVTYVWSVCVDAPSGIAKRNSLKNTHSESTTVNIPPSVEYNGISYTVISIGESAFANSTDLTSVTIPTTVTSIGNYAFGGCSGLQSITCEAANLPTLGSSVFDNVDTKNCTLYVPAESIDLYKKADQWKAYTNILPIGGQEVPVTSGQCGDDLQWRYDTETGVLTITGSGAMYDFATAADVPWASYAATMTAISLPEGLTTFGKNAFRDCNKVTGVRIPSTLTASGDDAFYGCTGLQKVRVDDLSAWCKVVFGNEYSNPLYYGQLYTNEETTPTTRIHISSDVTDLSAIAGQRIEAVEVEDIASYCTMSVPETFHPHEIYIGGKLVEHLVIPEGVTFIRARAFEEARCLLTVTFPTTLKTIGFFAFQNCSNIHTMTVKAVEPPVIDTLTFSGVRRDAKMNVPCESVELYMSAPWWSEFTNYPIATDMPTDSVTIHKNESYEWHGMSLNTEGVYHDTIFYIASGCDSIRYTLVLSVKECLIASGTCGENLTWELSCDSVLTISGTGTMTDYTSDDITPWFEYRYRSTIKSIVINDGITNIGNYAFSECENLTSVEMPNSIIGIGERAFQYCSTLTAITIPNNITSIEEKAFAYCTGLTEVTNYAKEPQTINFETFSHINLSALTLYVPAESLDAYQKADVWKEFSTIKAIGEEKNYITVAEALAIGQKLAAGAETTETYTVEGYVAKLYNTYNAEMKRQSFYMCDTKEEVNPEGKGFKFEAYMAKLDKAVNPGAKVTVTGKITNYISSKGVQTIEIKNGTCVILEEAPECLVVKGACGDNLTWELDYCNGHLVISGTGAMYDYEKGAAPWCGGDAVSIATIENGVTSLGRYAFYGCSMDSIFIATSVSNIRFNTFNNCYNLQNFEVAEDNPVFCSVEGVLFNKNRTKIVRFPRGRSGEYVIPDGVEIVGAGAFNGCTGVTSVIIPNSVVTIDYAAFYNCQMQSVTIPAKVDSIGIMTFGYCPLTSVINYAEKPQKLHSDSIAFEGVDLSSCALYVPAESVKDYQAADIWKDFGTLIPMQAEEVTEPITDVETQPEDNSVVVTWPVVESADTYTLEIKKNGELICTLTFSADGRLIGIAFAPARNGSNHAPAAVKTSNGGLRFTVTGLNSGTMYDLDVIAKDAMNQTITSYQKSFTTTGTATDIDQISNDQSPITNKVLRDGQIFILRGEKIYTVTGQEVK